MLTFEDVVHAPVDKLKAAADDWSEMAAQLEKLTDEARLGMKAKSDRARWEGVNAAVTKPFITKTAKEFGDAAAQAKGVGLLLADAHASFTAARTALIRIRDEEGPAAGVRVDARGRVHHVLLSETARHDPENPTTPQERAKAEAAVTAWQRKIDRLVEDCADADDSLRRALAANVRDENDFTAPKHRGLDAEQASRAADLMKRVTGEGGTARNVAALRELEDLLDDNRDDREFSADFYRRLGAEGTLEAWTRLSLDSTSLGPAGADRAGMVRNIQSDMGALLGLATQKSTPGHLDAAWTEQLLHAGRARMDSPYLPATAQVHGYQALGALMREGTYDKEFLLAVGRDMVAMDKQNPAVWDHASPLDRAVRINLDDSGNRGFQPLTGLMDALSRHPDASTAFFNEPLRADYNGDGIVTTGDGAPLWDDAPGILDHLLGKEPAADAYDIAPGAGATAQEALGRALEAAVTGRVPGDEDAPHVPHSAEMAGLMEKIVATVGEEPSLVTTGTGGDQPGRLHGLVERFGNMAAEYTPDLQATAENANGQIRPFGVAADFDKAQMAFFLTGVGQDPEAYGAITNAQQAYTTALVSEVLHNPDRFPDAHAGVAQAVHPGGEIAGMMTEARAQAVHDTKAHEQEAFNKGVEDNAKWTNRIIDMVGGKYIEMLPVAGDVITWIKEDTTASVVEGAKNDNVKAGARESADIYAEAERATRTSAADAVTRAGEAAGFSPEHIGQLRGGASAQAGIAHSMGRDLIDTTNP